MNCLITIATYEESRSACFLKEIFENENIDCYLAYSYNLETNVEEIQFQVKEEDVQHAVKVMMNIRETYGKQIEELEPTHKPYRILVPTDFSPGAEYACQYAIQMAHKLSAEVKILHVYENPIIDVSVKESATFEAYALHLRREMEKKAREGIMAFSQRMKTYMENEGLGNIRLHTTLAMGNIIRRIRKVSENYQPDLVVLGTVGRQEAPKSILAGVAEEIIKRLNIPVYAIPGPVQKAYFDEMRILYATDFNESDNSSLNRLLKIVEPFDTSITCIHIDSSHNPSSDTKMNELNKMLRMEYGQYKIECCLIEDEDVFHGIKEFASKNRINLLSITTQKRGIFEILFKPNLFKKILQESNLPMLIFPG
jgi:nucleotide-binding universal stress UspA family protein